MKIDPKLAEQIATAESTGASVEAVLYLHPTEDVQAMAHSLVAKVAQSTGQQPGVVNVLNNLGVVIVSAPPAFVRRMMEQPEFASAIANRQQSKE